MEPPRRGVGHRGAGSEELQTSIPQHAAGSVSRGRPVTELAAVARQHAEAERGERLLSLDAFRGIAIAAMILVNNPGRWRPVYAPLEHADWNGCTPADLIFPCFLFIVGVASTFSFGRRRARGGSVATLVAKVMWRTLVIFGLGLLLNALPYFDWEIVRVPGVLQRIALCYCVASIVTLRLGIRGQGITAALLLLGYWAVMKLMPFPGQATGGLGPGANLAAHIDDALLYGHLLHRRWDPEGILSTVPAIATTLCGVLTGHWLRSARSATERVAGLFAVGNLAVVVGLVMDFWFPINKSLWSSSYVVFTAGMALNMLGVCYWLIDIKGYRRWATPFVIYGTNPLVAYFLSTLVAKGMILWRVTRPDGSKVIFRKFLFEQFFLPVASPINATLLYAVAYMLVWWGVAAILYRKRIFIKI